MNCAIYKYYLKTNFNYEHDWWKQADEVQKVHPETLSRWKFPKKLVLFLECLGHLQPWWCEG